MSPPFAARLPQPPSSPVPPGPLPRLRDPMWQRGHTLLVVLMLITAVIGVVGAGFFAVGSGDAAGSGLSLLYALLPLPALLGCFFWLDRYEPEPWHYKLAAVVWGGVVAVAIALAAQIFVSETFDLSDPVLATFIAPVTEEPAKCLFLVLTFLRMRRVIDGVIDGLVFAGLVGLGFAFVENIGYYAGAYVGIDETGIEGAGATTVTFVLRGIMSPFAHPMFTAAFGIAVGLAVSQRSRLKRALLWSAGLLGSVLLHGIWNGGVSYLGGGGFLIAYAFTGLLLAATVVLAAVARRNQGRYLTRALTDIARRGWLVADEIPFIASLSYRRKAVKHARTHGGRISAKATRRYQRDAITMAFLYAGVIDRMPKPHAVERVDAFLAEMRILRPYVVLPPPLRFASPPVGPYGQGYGQTHGPGPYAVPPYGRAPSVPPGPAAPHYGMNTPYAPRPQPRPADVPPNAPGPDSPEPHRRE
ncbi:PrsW family intramembrane metalloprotease [Mumia sp. zg.B21]|uniref:PrsW family intramembrane metalloprotease n=1 Tax=unclassified Mumia TaxID=2621872 RepID=UPI001C6E4C5A|nr:MULTISPECIES: PrsW family glutamic-type intramembrane protease [unclassified Mumia]MBW9208282.1 PrsW family intramembrane metalloprotease [Mumia sp. zg.B21]MDD9348749.1 PrsW family glutamic-type intramembrane protease [Mumia sp.]